LEEKARIPEHGKLAAGLRPDPAFHTDDERNDMTDSTDAQASLEAVLKDEIIRMYQEADDNPEKEFHFYHGREAAERFGYPPEWLDRAPRAVHPERGRRLRGQGGDDDGGETRGVGSREARSGLTRLFP
jgi:hypothetical protein